MKKYFLHGALTAREGSGDALADILIEASKLVSAAKGCRLYVIGRDGHHPDTVFITEIWDTKDDHDASLKNEAVRALIGRAMPLIAGPPQKGQELAIIGGFGI